jgi:hypothetical protein
MLAKQQQQKIKFESKKNESSLNMPPFESMNESSINNQKPMEMDDESEMEFITHREITHKS